MIDAKNFENVKIIEDKNRLLGKTIRITESHMYFSHPFIQEVEDWEDKLIENNVPYVMAEVSTRNFNVPYSKVWTKKYALFIENTCGMLSGLFKSVEDERVEEQEQSNDLG